MSAARQTGIIFLDRNHLEFYEATLSSVLRLPFPDTVVKDLEVINEENFSALITSFIQANKIAPADITMVLSPNMFFDKDFPVGQPDADIQKFIDNVPFEEIASARLPLAKGLKVVTTNKRFYKIVSQAFEKLGSKCLFILPASVFGVVIQSLDSKTISLISQKHESVKQFNLFSEAPVPSTIDDPDADAPVKEETSKKSNKRTILLVAVFVVLLIVLVVVYISSTHNAKPIRRVVPQTTPSSTTSK